MGLCIATAAFISRAHGMGASDKIPAILGHTLVIGAICCVILALVGIFLSKDILLLVGHGDMALAEEGVKYLMPQLVGSFIFLFILVLTYAFQSVGDALTPMFVLLGVNVVNAVLNPLFISIWGLAGSSYAVLTARAAGGLVLLLLMYVMKKHKNDGLRLPRHFKWDFRLFASLAKVAGPSAVQSAIRNFGLLIMTAIVAVYGQASLAAYGICTRTDMMGLLIGMGVAQAVCVLVGQNLGAGNVRRAVLTVRYAVVLNAIVMILAAVCFVVFAPQILGFFGAGGESLSIGLQWFEIIPFASILMGLALTFGFAMNGAGRTWPGMIASLAGQVIIPVAASAFCAANGLPIVCVFLAVALGIVVNFIIDFAFYMQGGWKKQQIAME
jgi:putative efflux protein, MATE family